ncbi:MAG: 4-hydroxy-tetrahydrodipicolinate synthase [Clostridia bacterium]|nr:4-hydroxy-tetrahydrodipicolinate synthase [Clostridia bacterium]
MGRKKSLFFGSATALVTPFFDGNVDYIAFGEIIEHQISNGTDAIVILGTTGEASTIYENERSEIITFAKRKIGGRVPLIVGTGSNATSVAVRYTKSAEALGADGCLVVSPYYNKATPKGLVMHYKEIAKSVKIPIIVYNVPSRTGVNIPLSVYGELASQENIVAVKEAGGSMSYTEELIEKYKDFYDIYTGCDELILPTLALGGKGAISVVSNIVPSYVHQLCCEYARGNFDKARELQLYLSPLIKELFCEVNPIPVKTALYKMGMCKNEFRLPMCKSTREKQLSAILRQYSIIK